MFKKILIGLGLMFAVQTASFACDAMGDDKHVGSVTGVDAKAGTFTIMDAQLRKPLTFLASTAVLEQANSASGRLTVTFEQKDGQLIATGIE
jgi:hypothetical protein